MVVKHMMILKKNVWLVKMGLFCRQINCCVWLTREIVKLMKNFTKTLLRAT